MFDLEIPDAAYARGESPLRHWPIHEVDRLDIASEVLQAAAPLIVAAELRRLAKTWNIEIPVINAIYVRRSLRQRADELDPEGLTK
jgi:hypothetical protein